MVIQILLTFYFNMRAILSKKGLQIELPLYTFNNKYSPLKITCIVIEYNFYEIVGVLILIIVNC